MEKILTILLTVAVPGLFIFYLIKGALTIGRFALLFGLGIFVVSLYVGGPKGEWLADIAGIIILARYLVPPIIKFGKEHARPRVP